MNNNRKKTVSNAYTLGLDVGIASVGWALLADDHIVDLGVRVFDKAETADKGKPLNLARRKARLARRRLNRRSTRLKKLKRLFKHKGLPTDWKEEKFAGARSHTRAKAAEGWLQEHPLFNEKLHRQSPWILRVEGLVRLLDDAEWTSVIFHICKHRGFHWVSRADRLKEGMDKKGEGGKVKQGLAGTEKLMKDKGYRTAAEMLLKEFPQAQRNKYHEYNKALSRVLLEKELSLLFECQCKLGNPNACKNMRSEILGNEDGKIGLFWEQKPPLSGEDLLNMLGRCTFEKHEYRAPKASFSAERHVWLTKLNNLRIYRDGETRGLTDAERELVLPLPYLRKTKFTYRQLRSELTKQGGLDDDFKFTGLSYEPDKNGEVKDPETTALIELNGWQEIRKTLEAQSLDAAWKKMSQMALSEGESGILDEIAWVLSVYKKDEEVKDVLKKLDIPNKIEVVNALLTIRFDKFSNLSLKALRNILPHMARGMRYDEACSHAGYHHSLPHKRQRQTLLPPLYKGRDPKKNTMLWNEDMDIPRNPVVLRAINQARKVVNAIVRQYGSPRAVHIEMARDLSRPLDERQKIQREQEKYRTGKEKNRELFAKEFEHEPTGKELEKWMLYREQQGKCAYSLDPLDLNRVLEEDNYVQIDHVLPYSRSYDDSKNNKVLVRTEENQRKGDRTPYEYLDGENDSLRWQIFKAFVESNKSYRQAKRIRLLRRNFGEDEASSFRERNLNDTRYIARFLKNYIENYLLLADDQAGVIQPCVVLNGQLTAFLRARWGLLKVRDESDRHHALDAVVVAACSRSMVKRLADFSRRRELEFTNPVKIKKFERHFPRPWENFRDEVNDRLNIKDPKSLYEKMKKLGKYSENEMEKLRPIFVSRAPDRRKNGVIHKETIYSQPVYMNKKGVTQKILLSELRMGDLEKLVDPHRNESLYVAIRKRLEEYGGKAEEAFTLDNPLRKPSKKGNGPIVRTVTKRIEKKSGIPIRGGLAENGAMPRVDVFSRNKKFYLIPVYAYHRGKQLPTKAIVAGKDEEEWIEIDESFDFMFSLHPNDFVEVISRKGLKSGYFAGCDRTTGAINLWEHDRDASVGKKGFHKGIGVRTVQSLRKFHVDVLGYRYSVQYETRKPLR